MPPVLSGATQESVTLLLKSLIVDAGLEGGDGTVAAKIYVVGE